MSASVADPRLQNWFVNSSYDNDQLTYNSYTPPTTNPHHNNMYTHNHNNTDTNTIQIMPTTHPTPNQLFGTSIFGDTPDYNTISLSHHSHSHSHSHTPTPTLPHIQIKLNPANTDNNIKHLLTTLSYAIQEMNQYLDLQQNNPSCKAITAKTTNCRNEMVSTLSYYQTYIESNLNAQPLSPTHCTSPSPTPPPTQTEKAPYSPLNQGLEFRRMAYGNNSNQSIPQIHVSDAKLIALEVVGHIIGTPGPITIDDTQNHIQIESHAHPAAPTHLSPYQVNPATSPIVANSHTNHEAKHHDNMSTLNAYAQPYPTPYNNTQAAMCPTDPFVVRPTANIDTETTASTPYICPSTQMTQDTAIQQYYSTLTAQQRAAKPTPCNPAIATPQNRMDCDINKEIEVLTDNDDMAKSNSITTDNNDKEDESQHVIHDIIHGDNCDTSNHTKTNHNQSPKNNMKKSMPKAPQTNTAKPPLWSAIAKQIKIKPPTQSSHDEKSPESTGTGHRFNNNGSVTYCHSHPRNRNYNGSVSSASISSKSSNNNNTISPSPSPPNNNKNGLRRNVKERCRVFVSNLPPNVTDQDIRNAFAHCGDIANTVWFPSRTDGKFYGSGLITFCDGFGSRSALRMNQQNVLGRTIRCEYSSCEDPVKIKPPGCRTIYLNNVPRDAQEARIRQVFRHCGKIKRVRFHERDTKRTGGAFVEFENTVSCDKALDLHGKIVDNHPLYVDYQRY